jgi:hypothetical protein
MCLNVVCRDCDRVISPVGRGLLRHSLLTSLHRSHNHFIASFNYEGTMIIIEEVKATFQYFEATIGVNHTRSCILDLVTLRVP